MEPPLVKIPPPLFTGNPKIRSNQFMVTISSSAAAGEPAHPPEKILYPEDNESAIALIKLLGPGTNENDFGCVIILLLVITFSNTKLSTS